MDAVEKLARQVIGELIGLARATDGSEHLIHPGATAVMLEALSKTLPGAAGEGELEALIPKILDQKRLMVPDCFLCACPCGKTFAYDLSGLEALPRQERSVKEALLHHAQIGAACISGDPHPEVEALFYKALIAVGMEAVRPDVLETLLQEMKLVSNL